jgi:hypothetical protein
MRRDFSLLPAIFLMISASGYAQASPAPSDMSAPTSHPVATNQLASGTILSVELSKTLDAKKFKTNDKVEVRTATDLLEHGQIVIPRNTKIVGHVTEAKAHSNQSPASLVGFTFDHAVMKDGREVPLQASVQALGRPIQTANVFPSDDQMGGAPTAATGQRGSRIGSSAAGMPLPSSSGYPQGTNPGSRSDVPEAVGSTVSPLGPNSKGVVGLKGLTLDSSGGATVVSSKTDNVRLDGGSQLILRIQ